VRGRLGQLRLLREARRIKPPAILIVGTVAAMGTSPGAEAARAMPTAQQELIYAKQG